MWKQPHETEIKGKGWKKLSELDKNRQLMNYRQQKCCQGMDLETLVIVKITRCRSCDIIKVELVEE